MKKIIFWMLSMLAVTMVSCRPQQPNFLNVKLASGEDITASLKFEGRSEPISIVVDAGMKWFTKISAEDDWLKLEPSAGLEGQTKAKVSVTDKFDDGARRATIQFMMIGSSIVHEIEVIQRGGFDFIELTDPEGKELPSVFEFEETEAKIPFVINTGRRWTVKALGGADWVKVNPERGIAGTSKLELEVKKNTVEKPRKTTVRFTLVGGKNLTYDVEISQKPHVKEVITPMSDKDVLLDVQFEEDGSAKDVSIYGMEVESVAGPALLTYQNGLYSKNAAHFSASVGKAVSDGYYKVNYAKNTEFINKLKDGHSLEVLFSTNVDLKNTEEVKMFSSHQGGGTGMETKGGDITFLPYVKQYQFVKSGVIAQPGQFYHAVGVWNKDEGQAYIYVDGVQKGKMAASGNMTLSSIQWFGIGCDSGSKGENGWNGDVVFARIYDSALSAEDVKTLYEKVKVDQSNVIKLTDLEYLPNCTLAAGYKYHIYAKGFKDGDKVCFKALNVGGTNLELTGEVKEDQIIVTIPETLKEGKYVLTAQRGKATFPIGQATFKIGPASLDPVKTQVVAHRCYHKKHKENTIEAFVDTEALGVWGAEIDVHITKDKQIVVDHNGKFNGVWDDEHNFANYTLAEIQKAHPYISTFEEFLKAMTDGRVPNLNMVLEIKGQPSTALNNELVDGCAALIKKYDQKYPGLSKRIPWISFWKDICARVLTHIPDAMTMYLGNPPEDPQGCYDRGIMGIDYNGDKMQDAWIAKAHELGMIVNVWTINNSVKMQEFIQRGVDLITTDEPDVLKGLLTKDFITK